MKDLRHRRAPEIDLKITQAAIGQRRSDRQRARRYHRHTPGMAGLHDAITASRKKITEPGRIFFRDTMDG
jgi:hypothetical protein